jgi:hypothetical protein
MDKNKKQKIQQKHQVQKISQNNLIGPNNQEQMSTLLLDLCSKYGIDYSRNYVLSLYRKIIKEGKKLPTEGRRKYVQYKTIDLFREYKDEKDPEVIVRQIRIALFQFDTIQVQKENLSKFLKDDRQRGAEKTEEEYLQEDTLNYQKSLSKSWE